ncbi:MAG: type II secretion system protein, partial [Armatimonadota bacterium]
MSAAAPRAQTRQGGFTLLEVMVGMILLASIVVLLSQAFMAAISRADETGDHSLAAAWTQSYVDYLRNQGYSVSGTWTETPASCASPEPCMPAAFSSASIQVSTTAFAGLKQLDITLYKVGMV